MLYLKPLLISILGTRAAALSVTSPKEGDRLDFNQANTIKWSFEDSDPAYIDIDLSNEDHVLSINVNIAKNISSSDETYTFNDITAVPGSGYVLNLKDVVSGNIEAQSEEFSVVTLGNSNVTSGGDSSAGGNSTSQDDDDNAAGRFSTHSTPGICFVAAIIAAGWF